MPPRTPFQSLHIRDLGGGLNRADAALALADNQSRVLENAVFQGEGRVTSRRGLMSHTTVTNNLCGIFPFEYSTTYGVALDYASGTSTVAVRPLNSRGEVQASVGNLAGWTSVASRPQVLAGTLNERLFITDTERQHGLTIYQPALGTTLLQPTFDFESGGTAAAAAKPRALAIYNNMLFIAGYGTEADQNRPEMVRFSYPGLIADTGGGGDAGSGTSAGIFAMDDWVMVGSRGIAIIAMASTRGRLVMATEYDVYTLFGFSRNTFRIELLDNERGCVAARAMVEANGIVFWWSPKGPVMWAGGAVEDIGQKLGPDLVDEIDTDKMFAVHAPGLNQVRWFYATRSSSSDPDRALCFDYRRNAWSLLTLGETAAGAQITVFCGGTVRPTTDDAPLAAPSSVGTSSINSEQATTTWVNGDWAPETVTRVYRSTVNGFTPGASNLIATLPSGESRYTHTNLSASTTYYIRIVHDRNGYTETSGQATFTTAAAGTIIRPRALIVADEAFYDEKYRVVRPSVLLSWSLGEENVETQIHRSTSAADTFTLYKTAAAGATSYRDKSVSVGTTYYYRVRHIREGTTSNETPTTPGESEMAVTPTTTAVTDRQGDV